MKCGVSTCLPRADKDTLFINIVKVIILTKKIQDLFTTMLYASFGKTNLIYESSPDR